MGASSPHLVVVAGPNGAGKTTAAPKVLVEALGVQEFVNSDAIARGLSAFREETVAIQAGRIMMQRLRTVTAQRVDVAFETTLASRSLAPGIGELAADAYVF